MRAESRLNAETFFKDLKDNAFDVTLWYFIYP